MDKKNKSRKGRHPDSYVMLGGMVPPEKKAIAMVTASIVAGDDKVTVLDLIWNGVANTARIVGVLDANGKVSEKYRDTVEMVTRRISEKQSERRAKHGN